LGFVKGSEEFVESFLTQGNQDIHPDRILPSGVARLGLAIRNCVCGKGIIETITSYH